MLIDLKAYNTFSQMKEGLENKLTLMADLPIGSKVNVDIGKKILSNKQLRELEDTLLDYGMHLDQLMSGKLNEASNPQGQEEKAPIIEDIKHYDNTALICRHIRSGQKKFVPGNAVILGDINPGAELIAGGNILVMGSLRGLAHAGVFGDEGAIITAYRLNPTQLRIATHITRPPDGERHEVDYPELARIREGRVVIEKLKI
jgi:septum site-determining protein MinC